MPNARQIKAAQAAAALKAAEEAAADTLTATADVSETGEVSFTLPAGERRAQFVSTMVASTLSLDKVWTSKPKEGKPGSLFGTFTRTSAEETDPLKVINLKMSELAALQHENPGTVITMTEDGSVASPGEVAYFNEEIALEIKDGNLQLA